MTTTAIAGFSKPFSPARPAAGRGRARPVLACNRRTAAGSRRAGGAGGPRRAAGPAASAGVIGAAVLRTARRAAGLSQRALARKLAVPATAVRDWENGATPVYCVEYSTLRRIAEALGVRGGHARLELRDLLIAGQCDLLLAGMLTGSEDYAEVPPIEDDTADGKTARSFLRWALTGTPPDGREAAAGGPLLAPADIARIAATARRLRNGANGRDLAGFGQALEALLDA